MRRRIVAAALLLAALAAAGCRAEDRWIPRSRTPGVAGEPPSAPSGAEGGGPAGAEGESAPPR